MKKGRHGPMHLRTDGAFVGIAVAFSLAWAGCSPASTGTEGEGDLLAVDTINGDAEGGDAGILDTGRTDGELAGELSQDVVVAGPCETGEECDSGLCVTWPGGGRCTRACSGGCLEDEECRIVAGLEGEATGGVCVPRFISSCAPCKHSSDCRKGISVNGAESGLNAACLASGAFEWESPVSVCAAGCEMGACPEGMECKQVPLNGGGSGRYCIPSFGGCQCTTYAVEAALRGTCPLTNQFGTCLGEKRCEMQEGLAVWLECFGIEAKPEECNGDDDDCNGLVDDGWVGPACEVSNEFGACSGVQRCASGAPECDAKIAEAEVCDGEDNDCDGVADPEQTAGCVQYYLDEDKDGWGLAEETRCLCAPQGVYTTLQPGDCHDEDDWVFPGSLEICDNVDNDCDELVDEGCDDDGDGWCDAGMGYLVSSLCTKGGNDCDDENAAINPSAQELCDGLNNSCALMVDFGCDDDGDGWCDELMSYLPGALCALGPGDCDDNDASVNPGFSNCFQCVPGTQKLDSQGCAPCHARVSLCDQAGFWGAASECLSQCSEQQFCVLGLCKECLPGSQQQTGEGCEPCFQKNRTCSDSGNWQSWENCAWQCTAEQGCHEGTCVDCIPGTTETEVCSGCTSASRTCLSTGKWSLWGPCLVACPVGLVCYNSACVPCKPSDPPQYTSEGCDACSKKERTCTYANGAWDWGPWTQCISSCGANKVCYEGACLDCVPYDEEKGKCLCGETIRYCLPNGIWGPYSDCYSYCAAGFTCDNDNDCFATYAPEHQWQTEAYCGWGVGDGGAFVTVWCRQGDFCIAGQCRMHQYKNPGTQYTPYPVAGGAPCGTVNNGDIPEYGVFCEPGDICYATYCMR